MKPLHAKTAMCYASESRLPALKMVPKTPCRTEATGPQYFTFDPLPEVESSSSAHRSLSKANRIKRRSRRRVLYPPVVKRYYPAEERSYAKRILFILLTIVFVQIYSAEEDSLIVDVPLSPEENGSRCFVEVSKPLVQQEPLAAGLFPEFPDSANDTAWYWDEEEVMMESTIDITRFLEQSLAAF